MSGRSLVGFGRQSAEILYDVIEPPGELKDDAYEATGRLNIDTPLRIGGKKKICSRGE